MKQFTVRWGSSPSNSVSFDCDELPKPLYRHPYVSVQMNFAVSREMVEVALAENGAPA